MTASLLRSLVSSEYFSRSQHCCGLYDLDFSFDIKISTIYYWYHCRPYVPHFLSSDKGSKYLSVLSFSFISTLIVCWKGKILKSTSSFFLVNQCLFWLGFGYPFVYQKPEAVYQSHRTDFDLYIYLLILWSNFYFLNISNRVVNWILSVFPVFFLVPLIFFSMLEDCSECSDYDRYYCHYFIPHFFRISGIVYIFLEFFAFLYFNLFLPER